ncbi:unnamed protein product [marine sediment metagenome]|uniref:Uncharacterized protein n=1 Tax=marine sediment metagenome TaxID=412755 RepID=X0WFA1_9ZZZZ
MAIWEKKKTPTPIEDAVAQIRGRLGGAIETSRRALEVTVMLVNKHGRAKLIAELGEDDTADLKRIYALLKTTLAEIDPTIVTEDLPS